ncbi:hypothetical protein BKA70DRAFT_1526743 [Coprinopsis sp. MPI-PUGE-AT-0042]|nr:hypothetical protein BKA70DRAFT_1526743 [Coprinopsis sp. MPI-PUGE-AT-0042]
MKLLYVLPSFLALTVPSIGTVYATPTANAVSCTTNAECHRPFNGRICEGPDFIPKPASVHPSENVKTLLNSLNHPHSLSHPPPINEFTRHSNITELMYNRL